MAVKPDVGYDTARANAPRWLAQDCVKEAISVAIQQAYGIHVADRRVLIHRANKISEDAEHDREWSDALKGIDLMAKLNRLYDREAPDMEGYTVLMQQLNVNVQMEGKAPMPAIDVTPEDDASG